MDAEAQLAITDALVFLLIVIVIAAVSMVGTSRLWDSSEIYSDAEMKDYAEDTFIVLLRSTLRLDDCNLHHTQTVDRYILSRVDAEDSSPQDVQPIECDLVLHELARSLILERYGFVLSSTYLNETSGELTRIVFGPEVASSGDHFELSWSYSMIGFGKPGLTRIGLEIWRR